MEHTLDTFAVSDAPLAERSRIVRQLARAVADLHRRGGVHGALTPSSVLVVKGDVRLATARAASTPGFEAPEVARGGRATQKSDAFSLGALAQLALTGISPFAAPEPLETIRRVLFVDPTPPRLAEPRLPDEVERTILQLLEKRPRRRARPLELVRAIEVMTATATTSTSTRAIPTPSPRPTTTPAATTNSTARAIPTPSPSPTTTPAATTNSTARAIPTPNPSPTTTATTPTSTSTPTTRISTAKRTRISAAITGASIRAAARLIPASPLLRVALVTLPLLILALALGIRGDDTLARDVGAAIARGDHATARRTLDQAARTRRGDPLVEKLRGDLACARRAPEECVRRYRVALAASPDLRDDATLRRNARALLRRDQACATRRAAAQLLGELRDREALPALEEARRSGGLFAFLCTGDAIDRAIAAVRTGPKGDRR